MTSATRVSWKKKTRSVTRIPPIQGPRLAASLTGSTSVKIYWDDREYTFTRNKSEALLNAPSAGLAPGMVAVRLVDGDPHHAAGRLDGDYTLYFYVQRVP